MNDITIIVLLAILGAAFGSFAGAQVWRLRARQLQADKKQGEKVDTKELSRLKKLTKNSVLKDRSQCLHCSYTLKWYDLIPVVSWLSLRGKCRSCKKDIGYFELLIELGLAAFFALSFAFWPLGLETPLEVTHFVLWLAAGVVMAIAFAYDAKWFLLPDITSFILALIGAGVVAVSAIQTQDVSGTLSSAFWSVMILSGLYYFLYIVSRHRWVGFGDVKLGVGLALLLVDWQLALMAVFLANLIGTLIALPMILTKRLERSSHMPFGPLLIAGTVLAWFIGWPIFDWYIGLIGV